MDKVKIWGAAHATAALAEPYERTVESPELAVTETCHKAEDGPTPFVASMHEPESELQKVRRHAAHQAAHIAQHRALIDRLIAVSLATDTAEDVLSTMEQRLAFYQSEIRRLVLEPRRAESRSM